LAIFALVCVCGLKLRRDRMGHAHYTAPTVLLAVGAGVNTALVLYVVVSDLRRLSNGAITAWQSTSVVCGVMLAIGLLLYAVNRLAQRRLDAVPAHDEENVK
jgi:basic amino acid/polyamine antiporter, APA family